MITKNETTVEELQQQIERLTEENGWLSKECNKATAECAELQKQVDELKGCVISQTNYIERLEMDIMDFPYDKDKAVKDTAKEILQEGKYCLSKSLQDWIKERYGVEVE